MKMENGSDFTSEIKEKKISSPNPEIIMTCKICNQIPNEFNNNEQWLQHLLTSDHQKNAHQFYQYWSKEENERSIIILGCPYQVMEEPMKLLKDFTNKYGIIHEFLIHEYTRFIVLRFQNINQLDNQHNLLFESIEKIQHLFNGHEYRVQDKPLTFKMKLDISPQEWTKLTSPKNIDIDIQLKLFMSTMILNQSEQEKRRIALLDLENQLKKFRLARNPSIHPFGSYITGIGDATSDIDVYINMNYNGKRGELSREVEKFLVNKTSSYFRSLSNQTSVFIHLNHILRARIPIVQLQHRQTNIKFDLSFGNYLSVRNSELILFYTKYDIRVKPLLLIARNWIKSHKINGPDKLKSYGTALLVLTFLAKKKIIPSVSELQKGIPAHEIAGWNTAFNTNMIKQNSMKIDKQITKEILELTLEFFETYSKLATETSVISLYHGDFLSRFGFNDFPIWNSSLNTTSPLCIQDPFILDFNVSQGIAKYAFTRFQVLCCATVKKLREMKPISSKFNLMNMFGITGLPAWNGDKSFRKAHLRNNQDKLMELQSELDLYQKPAPIKWFEYPDTLFFNEHFKQVEGDVKQKAEYFWLKCVFELFQEFFQKGFNFNVKEIGDESTDSDSSSGCSSPTEKKPRFNDPTSGFRPANKSEEIPISDPERTAYLNSKLDEIHEPILRDLILHVSGQYKVIKGRAEAFKFLALPKTLSNPLDLEKRATNQILKKEDEDSTPIRGKKRRASESEVWIKFVCQVTFHIEDSKAMSTEISLRPLPTDIGNEISAQDTVETLYSSIKDNIPKYLEYRYKKWIGPDAKDKTLQRN